MRHPLRRTFAPALLTALTLVAGPALAFNPQPEPPCSPAFGIVESQAAQVDLVNLTSEVAGIEPATCEYLVRIHDASGELLFSEQTAAGPGEIASLQFRPRLFAGERLVLRVSVDLLGDSGRRLACNGATRGSVQLIHGRSGFTQLVLPIVTDYLPSDGSF